MGFVSCQRAAAAEGSAPWHREAGGSAPATLCWGAERRATAGTQSWAAMGEKFPSQQPPGRGAVPTLGSPIRQRPRSPAVSGAKMENLQSTGTGEPQVGPAALRGGRCVCPAWAGTGVCCPAPAWGQQECPHVILIRDINIHFYLPSRTRGFGNAWLPLQIFPYNHRGSAAYVKTKPSKYPVKSQ